MKKYLALILVAVLALSLCACAGKTAEETTVEDAVETTVADDAAAEGVMSYEEYAAAEVGAEVTVQAYVQASQGSWEQDGATLTTIYLADENGAYFVYQMEISADDAEAITTAGTLVKLTGTKSEWSGEIEITDVTAYEIISADAYVAEAKDITEVIGTDAAADDMNKAVTLKGAVVEAANDDGAAYLYKWDGSGEDGDDLYFNVKVGENTYTFVVESYLDNCGAGTDVYEGIKALEVGKTVDLEGFLYWYEGPQMQVTAVTVVE